MIIERENAITAREIEQEVLQSRYYNYEEHKWETMGWIEWLVREIFCCFFYSSQKTCRDRSWSAIEKMRTIPKEIAENIEDLLLDSLYETNRHSAPSEIISRIFCRIFREKTIKEGYDTHQIDIQQDTTDRIFKIFCNGENIYLVRNSNRGIFDFYNLKNEKMFINDHDSLWDNQGKRVAGIRLAVDYPRMDSSMELNLSKDLPAAKVWDNRGKVLLVFRDAIDNQLLAVANLSRPSGLIKWTITVIKQNALNQKEITPLLLAWVTLKYSQHYHFSYPIYVEDMPDTNFAISSR